MKMVIRQPLDLLDATRNNEVSSSDCCDSEDFGLSGEDKMLCGENTEGLSASLEDYLEVIFHLEQSNRVARAKISPIR